MRMGQISRTQHLTKGTSEMRLWTERLRTPSQLAIRLHQFRIPIQSSGIGLASHFPKPGFWNKRCLQRYALDGLNDAVIAREAFSPR